MTVWAGLIALGVGLGASLFLPVPQNLKTSFEAGQSLYALGEYKGAIEEYSKIVKFKSAAVRTDSVKVSFGDNLTLPVVAAAWYQLGNAYKKSGEHEKAVAAYQHVVTSKQVSEDFRSLVQFQIAETRFYAKQYAEAAKEYKHYVSLFPKSDLAGKAFFYAGWSEFNQKHYDEAIATLREMLKQYPDDHYAPDAQFRIASSYFQKGDYEEAIKQADLAASKYPNSPVIAQATYLKANALDKLGQDAGAITAYREVRGMYNRMYEMLRGSFREGKNVDFDNYRKLFETSSLRVAEILSDEGKFDEALKELIAAQETAEERFYKAKVQMRIGDLFMRKGKVDTSAFADAYTAYNQVIALYSDTPYPPNAQYQKGEARYFAGHYTEARKEYLKVLSDYPDCSTSLRAASLYSAGWSAEKAGDKKEALVSYNQAVESFPRSTQAPLCLLRIARIHYDAGETDESIKAYQQVVDKYAATPQVADAYYGLGLVYRDAKRFDDAIAAFSKVSVESGQTYISALVAAANIYVQQGQPERGKELLTQLLKGVAGNRQLEARATFQIAQLDLNNKQYQDALSGYDKVIKQFPDSPVVRDAHYGRALAYHWLGHYSKALGDYRWLLNNDLPPQMRVRVQFSMALSYAALQKDAKARELLNAVIAAGDESLAASARLQLISMAEKRDPKEAISIYEEMLQGKTTPQDRERILLRLASAYFSLNQFDRSVEAAQRLIDLGVTDEGVANALFVQGNSYYKAGKYAKAIEVYRKIIDTYPQIGWARNAQFQIGVCYNKLSSGGHVEMLPAMSKAFQTYYTKYPDDDKAVYAYYYDAWARYRLGKWKEASDVFAALAHRYPKSHFAAEALFRAGDAIFNMRTHGKEEANQKWLEAMAYYEEVVAKYPKSDYVDDALYDKAWCLINLGRKEEAVPVFEQIVRDYPDGRYGPRSQFTLGDYYYGLKDYKSAAAAYKRFLELFPEERLRSRNYDNRDRGLARKAKVLLGHLAEIDAYNLYSQGEKLFDQKRYDEAIAIFRQVEKQYPKSDQAVNAQVNIGAAYVAKEEFRKAGELFQHIVEKYSDNPKYSAQVDFARQQLEAMQKAQVL